MIDWLDVQGVRNLARQRIELAAGLVVLAGRNAQGKSSVLEAAYLLTTTRSFRTVDPREAIAHGEPVLRVQGALLGISTPCPVLGIALGRKRGERALSVGEYESNLADFLAYQPTLALAGESIRAIAGSPTERRRYVDRATAAADPVHLADLGEYRRALAQRNRLVKAASSDALLEPWDTILARSGEAVARRRRSQVAAWEEHIALFPELFPEGSQARLKYREAGLKAGSGASLLERLIARRDRDREMGQTSVGPHRDDLEIDVDGTDLLRFGSAGQVRAALSAITIAQARHVKECRGGRAPLLVLDDVDTDLDPGRLHALLEHAAGVGQVLAATSKPGFDLPAAARRLTIDAGCVADG